MMDRQLHDEVFELTTASAENTYAKAKINELHDKLVDIIPLMTDDDLMAFSSQIACELNERDKEYQEFIKHGF